MYRILFSVIIVLFTHACLIGQNIVPNYDFSLGQNGQEPYCVQVENINDYILDWKRALNAQAIACAGYCPSPDWVDVDCLSDRYPIMPDNRWIHSVEGGGPYREGMRVKLTEELVAGETYTITYWVVSTNPMLFHVFSVYLSNWGKYWDQQPFWAEMGGRNRILIDKYSQPIAPFVYGVTPSPYQPMALNWHQRRSEFKVPNNMNDLEHLVLISRHEYHEFDDVILTQGGCNDPLVIDNTTFRPGVHHPYYGTPILIGYNGAVNSEGATLTFISPIEVQINEIYVPGYEAFHVYNAPCDCESPVANPGSAAIICANNPPYQLGGPAQEWMTYNWTCEPLSGTNYLSSTTISDPVLTPPTTGNHQLVYTLTVTNTCGESFSEEVPIIIVNTPDDTPELSVNFFTTEWPVRLWMLPSQWMETISIELYNYGGSTPVQTWDLQAFQDFQPGEDFSWEFEDVLPICDGYTIKVRGQNMCSEVWSDYETLTVEPFGGIGSIEELSNVVSMNSPSPNNAITLIHTGFVHFHLKVFSGSTGIKIHEESTPIVSNQVVIWNGLDNSSGFETIDGTYMFILKLTDCEENVVDQSDFWTVLNSSQRLSDPNSNDVTVGNTSRGDTETVEDLGVSLKGFATPLVVIPNPNNGSFRITGTDISTVILFDATGKLVRQLNGGTATALQVDGLGAGLYLVRAQMVDGSVESAKVVVN